jgi:uncharacterized paraquat-inducible protein A
MLELPAVIIFGGVLIVIVSVPLLLFVFNGSDRRYRERCRRLRVCHVCDYDLTGNVAGVCPECGTETRASSGGLP